MRLIVLDVEVTGLSPTMGDRIVEIGAVELCPNDLSVKSTFHKYINPDRHIPYCAVSIHGIDDEYVKDEPKFESIAQDFLNYIEGGTLVIHNPIFALGFISQELELCNLPSIGNAPVIDTLEVARTLFPGKRISPDALLYRFEVDRIYPDLQGSLLVSSQLADVYIALTKRYEGELPVKAVRDYILRQAI